MIPLKSSVFTTSSDITFTSLRYVIIPTFLQAQTDFADHAAQVLLRPGDGNLYKETNTRCRVSSGRQKCGGGIYLGH